MRSLMPLALTIVIGWSPFAAAQDTASCRDTPGFSRLDFWLGDWEVLVGSAMVGENRIEKVLEGCAIVEHWTAASGSRGMSLFYYLAADDVWKQVWVTQSAATMGGVKEKTLIQERADGSVVFQGRISLEDGGAYLDRTTLSPRPDGSVRQLIQVSADGTAWQTTFDATYRRQVESEAKPSPDNFRPGTKPAPSAEIRLEVGEFTFQALLAGPPGAELVVLLHGFPQTSHVFRNQIPVLADKGFRVLAPNQRGYSAGARPVGVESYAMDRLVDDVIGMADALNYSRFHLVGHDWGAVVAWFTAMMHPERVTSLFAISIAHPFAYGEALKDPQGEQARSSGYMGDLRAPDAANRLLANDAVALREVFSGSGIPGEDIDVYLGVLGTPESLNAALNWYRAMGTATTRTLTPIRMPTTYLWGAEDRTMSRRGAELTEKYVEGPYRFEILEGVGHWVPEQAAQTVNRLLVEHLAGEP